MHTFITESLKDGTAHTSLSSFCVWKAIGLNTKYGSILWQWISPNELDFMEHDCF